MKDVLKKMTLQQKIALCSGENEWDTKEIITSDGEQLVPSAKVADGPHGLRKTVGAGDNLGLVGSEPSTCFPAESILACSFDTALAGRMGAAIADEARSYGVSTVLGPGANIKRNPLCGRNFEYFSEDPYLSGRMAAAYIDGMQERGIGCSLKHFACNSQEYYRLISDSRMDERTLREIYLSAFEYAIKNARPATVMCSYNRVNGTNLSDHQYLLDTVLRQEWGYEGMVVSDWGALNDRVAAFRAGCDLIMPGGSAYGEKDAKKAVESGTLEEELVDRSAARVAAFARKRRELMEDATFSATLPERNALFDRSHAIARELAEQSAVLLKNEDGLLPIAGKNGNLCVIGTMAQQFRFQGSGSSKINPTRREDVLALLNEAVGDDAVIPYAPGYDENGDTNEQLISEAVELAKKADTVLLFAGLPERYEAEGFDRHDMHLPVGQDRLISAVVEVNPHVAVVLICGCAVELPWEQEVKSILYLGLAGQAAPRALVNLLSGKTNPSGKLAETWPLVYEDCPSADTYLKCGRDAEYREGIYVGYRYYEKAGKSVRYPFGHGLSYTTFAYENLTVTKENDAYCISVNVKNTGSVSGRETVLLFVAAPQDGIHRPVRELKAFTKVELQPGEEKTVSFVTDERTFAVYHDGWKIFAGNYRFMVGDLEATVSVAGERWKGEETLSWYKTLSGSLDREAWLKTLPSWRLEDTGDTAYSVNSTLQDVSEKVWLLRVLYRAFERKQAKLNGRGSTDYLVAMSMANECPLRMVQAFLKIKTHFAQAMADFANGHPMKGLKNLIS